MATILSYLPRPASAARRDRRPEGPAAIIIFPGVRYERGEPGPHGSKGGGSPARKASPARR